MKINYRMEKMSMSASRTAEAFGELRGVKCVCKCGAWVVYVGMCWRTGVAVDEAATIHGG